MNDIGTVTFSLAFSDPKDTSVSESFDEQFLKRRSIIIIVISSPRNKYNYSV